MKNFIIFIVGFLTGIILTFVVLLAVYAANINNNEDDISYFETPISYENKKSTSFQVFQVLGNTALANEISNKKYELYNGKTVLLLGNNFYTDQIVKKVYPQQVGTYTYQTKQKEILGTTIGGDNITVPVIGQ
ncbi:MAG: VPDSG-CTERM exosortase interaction domain protein [Bacteroidaceae bacterium]|nr:VPDSG-CTERM exosortase interaction domain protein [Bacteroidaceae bacterium]